MELSCKGMLQDHPSAPWFPLPVPIPITAAGTLAAQKASQQQQAAKSFMTVMRYPTGQSAESLAPLYYSYAQYVPTGICYCF
jgi:hypothetical protein